MAEQNKGVTVEHHVTPHDIENLLAGEGGVDLHPVLENGHQVGMRVVGVQPGTTAARLGAQNDDVIESINDIPLTSIGVAYAAGAAASKATRVLVRGRRAGAPYVTVLVIDGG